MDGRENWLRGRVEAPTFDGKWTIKGLNADSVPEPVLGRATIAMREDGRFGKEDPLLWPQVVSLDKEHLPFIPRRPDGFHPAALLWDTPDEHDFERVNDEPLGEAYGRITRTQFSSLHRLVEQLGARCDEVAVTLRSLKEGIPAGEEGAHRRRALEDESKQLRQLHSQLCVALDMFRVSSTLRECVAQWAHLHRCYAELWAWLEWRRASAEGSEKFPDEYIPTHRGLDGAGVMGGFTTDKRIVARLYLAGSPVWMLIRSATAAPGAEAVFKLDILDRAPIEHAIIFNYGDALVGTEHIAAIWKRSHAVLDVEHVPLPEDYALPAYQPAGTQQALYKPRVSGDKQGSYLLATLPPR